MSSKESNCFISVDQPLMVLIIICLIISSLVIGIVGAETPVADFNADTTSGSAPLSVSFIDLSSNGPSGWAWYFGDEKFTEPWTQMTNGAAWSSRFGHSSVSMPDGSIVLIGGQSNSGFMSDVWRSTDQGKTWIRQTENIGRTIYAPSSVAMPDNSIILLGGLASEGWKNDVWRSTDQGKTWTLQTASAEWSARYEHTSVILPDGSIVLMGGGNSSYYKNDVWRSTDQGKTWTLQTANAGWSGRIQYSSVIMPDGTIVLMGGQDINNGQKNDVWRSTDQGKTWTLQTASAKWSPRQAHTSVVMPDGSIVLMGGYSSSGNKNDVWRSTDQGKTWIQQTASAEWLERGWYSTVLMPDSSIVLMGGYSYISGIKNDVWRFMPAGSLLQNPSHTYSSPGTYSVTLQVYNEDGYNSEQKVNYITTNLPPAPTVTGITPTSGINTDSISITDLAGTGFINGATVKLTKAGQSDIAATRVTWVSSTKIVCDIPITGAVAGDWNVIVTNPDNQADILSNGFSINNANQPPVLTTIGPQTVDEGGSLTLPVVATDPENDAITYSAMDLPSGATFDTGIFSWTPGSDQVGDHSVTFTATAMGGSDSETVTITVNNVNQLPIISTFTLLSSEPIPMNTLVAPDVAYTDIDGSVITSVIDWGDGTADSVGSHQYTATGVYTLTLTVTDSDELSASAIYEYAVIYNPFSGFISGHGTTWSQINTSYQYMQQEGKAKFGFVSKYEKGATIPTGTTAFQFKAADLDFTSTNYDWLVVAGARAQYKGSGTINNAGNYGFLLTAIDGSVAGGGGIDKFRIKIWDKITETVVYDNQAGTSDESNPTTIIETGNIIIHK